MHPFFHLLHPHLLLARLPSPYNQSIEVYSEFGQPRLIVDGMPQSGGIVTDILKKSLKHFNQPHNFLLLGLGGGDILHHIHRRWPNCQITAVEIDPAMTEIAKKYFKIDQIPNLKIINQDAYQFVVNDETNNVQRKTNYDAILVDCYLGRQIPEKLESTTFLTNLKNPLSPSGTIAFNRLDDSKQAETKTFINKLKEIFLSVMAHKAFCNQIVIAMN